MPAAPNLSYDTHDAILAYWNTQAPLAVGLLMVAPNADGSNVQEPSSAAGYARQTVSLAPFVRDGSGLSSAASTQPLVFGPALVSNWPSVTYGALFGANGRLLAYAPLPAARAAPAGDTISFGAGVIQFRFR